MNTLNLIIICITVMAIAAIAGATVENVFRIIYEDPEQEIENDINLWDQE